MGEPGGSGGVPGPEREPACWIHWRDSFCWLMEARSPSSSRSLYRTTSWYAEAAPGLAASFCNMMRRMVEQRTRSLTLTSSSASRM